MTLTLCGHDWPTRRNRVKRLTHAVKADYATWNIVWCVEPNPRKTGHHVHALVEAPFVEQPWLSITCDRLGLGKRVTIEAARSDEAGHYAVKAGLYSAKGCAGGPAAYGRWLQLAGGRGVHWSRRAFAGRTFPEAYVEYLEAKGWTATDPGPWVRERADRSPGLGAVCPVEVAERVLAEVELHGWNYSHESPQERVDHVERPAGDIRRWG